MFLVKTSSSPRRRVGEVERQITADQGQDRHTGGRRQVTHLTIKTRLDSSVKGIRGRKQLPHIGDRSLRRITARDCLLCRSLVWAGIGIAASAADIPADRRPLMAQVATKVALDRVAERCRI